MILLPRWEPVYRVNNQLTRLCRARDMLREADYAHVPLEQIARETALSPYHFIRVFKALFGETPHQVRIKARLEHAKDLLIKSDQPVTEICTAVGFSSLGTFSELFTRRVGLPPSVYRRQIRAMVQVPETIPRQLIPGCFCLMFGWPE